MTLTPEEMTRKTQARRLIKMPVQDRPSNVLYQLAATLEFARYQVIYGSIVVCFQHDGKRFSYLGEYPAENFLERMTIKTTEVQKGEWRRPWVTASHFITTVFRRMTV